MRALFVALVALVLSTASSLGFDRNAVDKFIAELGGDNPANVQLLGIAESSAANETVFYYRMVSNRSWYQASCVTLVDGGWLCQSFQIGAMGSTAALVK